jgi:hypothetical protein
MATFRFACRVVFSVLACVVFFGPGVSFGQSSPWYTQGDFVPRQRMVVDLINDLNIDRVNVPVVIRRDQFPIQDLHELAMTVVDPDATPSPAPSPEQLRRGGAHELREEANGHALPQQMDDLDKDGIWDELFFMLDGIKAGATKRIVLYVGMNQRGWNPHETHAGIGSYMRHLVPFWETGNIGWKLWFPTSIDVYGKRKPMLMANRLYMENLDGYSVSLLDRGMGSDIQSVDNGFGAGAICLFENPDRPTDVSSPRFTPARTAAGVAFNFNAGPISDTRYAFDVVVNGPVRSMIRVKTMNWNSGKGSYEAEQIYTAYARQSYSTCLVRFPRFAPMTAGVFPGVGIRKKPAEDHVFQKDGVIITSGPETITDPETGRTTERVDMIAGALVVKDQYRPEYRFVADAKGNHTFKVTPNPDGSFEYMIAGAWSEGAVLQTYEAFERYVRTTAREYASPVRSRFVVTEKRD